MQKIVGKVFLLVFENGTSWMNQDELWSDKLSELLYPGELVQYW